MPYAQVQLHRRSPGSIGGIPRLAVSPWYAPPPGTPGFWQPVNYRRVPYGIRAGQLVQLPGWVASLTGTVNVPGLLPSRPGWQPGTPPIARDMLSLRPIARPSLSGYYTVR